ncbi:MAG: LuxR C-terminal-related transcriptional regulator [Corynebacterium sp.]|uniref:helix-turn-helix transcriptional regulator n=1 Tax=Corynebacterium sp. TaxID=1720 RepID=UPI0026E026A2|nr:LuxR C-terminal-related transcriptional regulator [Corynebacterium sp.]MDO5670451.1 LuxR C-terminal-related transcriptional regulator [Corynebacterium sp.]
MTELSKREIQVAITWLTYPSKKKAAFALGISEDTVRTHIARIRGKYMSVGRPAATKSDLMIRLIQDGHYQPGPA